MVETIENHWSYDLLKDIAMRESNSLDELKGYFANDINSPRRLECIRSIDDLLDCLERRDVISEQNVEPLRHFHSTKLSAVIDNYVSPPNPQAHEPVNEYHQMHLAENARTKLQINGHTPPMNGNIRRDNVPDTGVTTSTSSMPPASAASVHPMALSERKRAAIYKLLAQNLGTYWRSFGRELNLREGDMDDIELQCPRDLPTRIYKVLERFEEDDSVDPKQHLQLIREALDQCRRKDVRRQVDGIMSH